MYHTVVKRAPMVLLVVAVLLMAGCSSGTRPPRIGETAPDFTVRDGSETVTLHNFRGKVVVLNFWATWCPPCVEEMPSLVNLQSRLKGTDVTVVAVSIDVDATAYKRFLVDHHVDLLTVRDPDQKAPSLYGSSMWPETYIIDRKGVIRRKFIGAVDWNEPDLVAYLKKL